MELPDRLAWALKHAERTQADLARALKISKSAVTQWASGATNEITPKHLFRAARFLGVEPEWLGTGAGPRTPAERYVADIDPSIQDVSEIAKGIAALPPSGRVAMRALLDSFADAGPGRAAR